MNTAEARPSGYREVFTLSFSALLAGQIVSIFGDRLNNIAMIELISAETSRFATPGATFELSKLALAMTLPSLVLGPLAGAYVDRVNRKKVLIITDLVRGLAVMSIPFMRPALPLWMVYGAVAVLYFANLFFLPARCAIVTEIVRRDRLMKANSFLSLGATLATIAGFGLGGAVATKGGWRLALFIDSATYFVSAGALAFITPLAAGARHREAAPVPYLETLKEAAGAVRRMKATRAGVFAPPIMVLAGTSAYVLGVAMIESTVPQGTMYIGFLVGLGGVGVAAGSYFTGRVLHRQSRSRLALAWTPLVILPLMAIGLTASLVAIGLAVAIAGFAAGPVFVSSETAVQEEAPRRRQATVFALRDMLMKLAVVGAASLSAAAAGWLGNQPALLLLLGAWLALALGFLVAR